MPCEEFDALGRELSGKAPSLSVFWAQDSDGLGSALQGLDLGYKP